MYQILEQINIFTPLGIRFVDVATDAPVRDGLFVTARPLDLDEPRVQAFRTASGVFAFQRLPGLRDVEYMIDDGLGSPPQPQSYLVEVRDFQERFLPVVFQVELPFPERGLFPLAAQSSPPADPPPGFYLFSAPSRSAVPGLAVVHAQLQDAATGEPAAHALLELENQGETWFGVADAEGRLTVQFPYPPLTVTLQSSPPFGSTPLHAHTWTLDVRVRYAPDTLTFFSTTALPEFRSVSDQAPGLLYEETPDSPVIGTPVATTQAMLRYGEQTVLRTRDGPQALSVLLIEPQP